MKKIIFTFLVFFLIFLIYYFNINEKVYYASIGDYLAYGINNFEKVDNSYSKNIKTYYKNNLEKYVNYSTIEDYRINDLINDINYNKKIFYEGNEYQIQNILIKSNYITLSIGMNDVINKKRLTYDYMDQLTNDINKLFKLIRKYNKDRIDFLGFYNIINNKQLIDYTNNRLKKICQRNKINYIDISELNNNIIKYNYPTNSGYTYITNKIINFTK